MANIIPLLALVGAGAYIYTKKQKASSCPKQIVVDQAKVAPEFSKVGMEIMQELSANQGQIDANKAADRIFAVFAPLKCKAASTVIIAGDEQAVASEFYQSLVAAFKMGKDIADVFDNLKGSGGICPTSITRDYEMVKSAGGQMLQMVTKTEDPVGFANKMFALIAPTDCKWNAATMVELTGLGTFSAPQLYGAILNEVLDQFSDKGFINQGDGQKIWTEFADKYKATVGQDWTDPMGA